METMTQNPHSDGQAAAKTDIIGFLARFAPLIFLILLMGAFAVGEPRFLTPLNLFNVLRQVSIYGLVAAAVSKGGLSNRFTVGAGQEAASYGWYLAALAAIGVGLVGGFLQGLAITRLKVPPFVVTLGGMSAFRGAALLFAAGGPISGFEPGFVWMGQGRILGQVPVPVVIFLTFAVVAHVVLRYTRYGRQVYAVGGNPEAARLSGLNVRAVTTSVYVI